MTAEAALLDVLHALRHRDYRFTAVTPASHQQILSRTLEAPPTLRDIFGWNRPFVGADVEATLLELMRRSDIVRTDDTGTMRSRLRVASLDDALFLHSSFPTTARDAVFFGPDSYRFVRFNKQHVPDRRGRIVDMGAGSGVGGIMLAKRCPDAEVTLVDTNPEALRLARINAATAGVEVKFDQSDRVPTDADLVIANPPYMIDDSGRSYRSGGGLFGGELTLDWVRQFLGGGASGRRMLLYTGCAYVDGRAPLLDALNVATQQAGAAMTVDEIDPDVFGEELAQPAYREVERIAAVGIAIDPGTR